MESHESISVYHEIIKIPLFPVEVDVFVGYDPAEMEAHIKQLFPGMEPELTGRTLGGRVMELNHHSMGQHTLVAIMLQKDREVTKRTIVHEVIHLTWAIMQQVGVHCNYHNDEVQAYLAEEVWELLDKSVSYGYENIILPDDRSE